MNKYKCTACGHVFDAKFKHTESETATCPSCFSGAEMVTDLKVGIDKRNKNGYTNFGMDNKQSGVAD